MVDIYLDRTTRMHFSLSKETGNGNEVGKTRKNGIETNANYQQMTLIKFQSSNFITMSPNGQRGAFTVPGHPE